MLLKALRLLYVKAFGREGGDALEEARDGYVTHINSSHIVPEAKISDKACQTSEMYHNGPSGWGLRKGTHYSQEGKLKLAQLLKINKMKGDKKRNGKLTGGICCRT